MNAGQRLDLNGGPLVTSHVFNASRLAWWRSIPTQTGWPRKNIRELVRRNPNGNWDAISTAAAGVNVWSANSHVGGDGSFYAANNGDWQVQTGGPGILIGPNAPTTWGLAAWVFIPSGDTSNEPLYYEGGASDSLAIYASAAGNANKPQILMTANGITVCTLNASTTLADGKWHWLLITRGGATLNIYSDCVSIGAASISAGAFTGSSYAALLAGTTNFNTVFLQWDSFTIFTGFTGYRAMWFEEMNGCPQTLNWADAAPDPRWMLPAPVGGPWPFHFDELAGGLQTQGMAL